MRRVFEIVLLERENWRITLRALAKSQCCPECQKQSLMRLAERTINGLWSLCTIIREICLQSSARSVVIFTIIDEIDLHFPLYYWFFILSVWFSYDYSRIIVHPKGVVLNINYLFLLTMWKFPVSLMIVPVSSMIVQSYQWLFLTPAAIALRVDRHCALSQKRWFVRHDFYPFIVSTENTKLAKKRRAKIIGIKRI